jgi:hypothetical protein
MANILFNKKHLGEYASYGGIAGLLYAFSVWYFLFRSDYRTSPVLFIGSAFFMFVIMIYAFRLIRRKSENYSTWMMIIAGQMAVAVGIIVSVIVSFALCCFYIPGFVNSSGTELLLRKAINTNDPGRLELIFMMAIIANYCAGAFISAMVAYALKPDQTRDETPAIFEEPAAKIL